jgi:hypothetical protein
MPISGRARRAEAEGGNTIHDRIMVAAREERRTFLIP